MGGIDVKRLVYNGKQFVFVETSAYGPPSIGATPRKPQKAHGRPRIISERMADFRPLKVHSGYRPAPLLDLGPDQCRYTIRDTIMCGNKCEGGSSWCSDHAAVCYRGRVAWDSVRMQSLKTAGQGGQT